MTRQQPGDVRDSTVTVGAQRFRRVVVRTAWLRPNDDISQVMRERLLPHARSGDLAIVSETAVVVTEGLGVSGDAVVVTPLAESLARRVRPRGDSRGLSIPAKMQFVIDQLGMPRTVAAAAVSAVTRPLGLRGGFYVIAGRLARSLDGLRPPFEDLLLPPLHPRTAHVLALRLARRLGLPVAIVDINDRGGSIRAVSHPRINRRLLLSVLADNPLGQRDQRTPIALVSPAPGLAAATRPAPAP